MDTVQIVTPATDENALTEELRRLVRFIHILKPDTRRFAGVLGGADGYGVDIETPVFVMRMHDENPPDCSCGAENRNNVKYFDWVERGRPQPADWENEPCARDCASNLPNFRHNPSGFEVRWHKWIGRSMELLGECPDPKAMIDECVRSLS